MESPACWKRAEEVIEAALDEHDALPDDFAGASLPHRIADALRQAGLLNDQDERERGWMETVLYLEERNARGRGIGAAR